MLWGTKGNYKGKLNTIKLYLLNLPNARRVIDRENNIIVPLAVPIVKALFGWLSTNTDLPKQKRGTRRNNRENDDDDDDDDDDEEDNNQSEDTAFGRNEVAISHT